MRPIMVVHVLLLVGTQFLISKQHICRSWKSLDKYGRLQSKQLSQKAAYIVNMHFYGFNNKGQLQIREPLRVQPFWVD